jgi:uncharacterized protein (DUF1778 family)
MASKRSTTTGRATRAVVPTPTPRIGAAEAPVRLEVRPTRDQKSLVEEAASSLGQTVASFMLSTVLERANEVLLSRVRVLSDRDRDVLLSALDDEEPPVALRRAFAERKRSLRKRRA